MDDWRARDLTPLARLSGWRRRRRRVERLIDKAYPGWVAREPGRAGRAAWLQDEPLFSILMPVRDPPRDFLREAIVSIVTQDFAGWELCIADDGSVQPVLADTLALFADDPRVKVTAGAGSVGIAAATNAALAIAEGEFVVLIDHDDLLAPDALARVALEIEAFPEADLIFSDEDKIVQGARASPYFKPGWNPDLMLAQNLVSHLGIYRRSMMEKLGGLRAGFEGSQDYDLALRASCTARCIRHVPEILYHWRQSATSFSASKAAACAASSRRAVADHVGPAMHVLPDPALPQWVRVVHPVPSPAPLVSVILAGPGTAPCDSAYPWIEPAEPELQSANGAILLFISPHLVSCGAGWLRELVSHALRPEIGCVGARLDGADGSILHAGYWLDPDRVAQSPRPGSDADDPGYRGHFRIARSVSAVSDACLAIRADLFREVGGFDAEAGSWRAVDLCLRLAEGGLRTVWTPHARLRWASGPQHPEDAAASDLMRRRWTHRLGQDPYANRNLVLRDGALALR